MNATEVIHVCYLLLNILDLRITKHPQTPPNLEIGDKIELSVSAEGSGTLTYQWMKDGNPLVDGNLSNLTGVNTHSLTISSFSQEHEGVYKCTVSSDSGDRLESTEATLTCMFAD